MQTDRIDYTDSGLSTVEAINQAERLHSTSLERAGLPGFLSRFLARFLVMRMGCDGQGCASVGRTSGRRDERGFWKNSGGWIHRADLDFCPPCQQDGKMDAAIAAGVRPRGA